MAKEIPEELKTFKEKVSGKLSSISSTTSDITSKIQELVSASTSTASAISSSYQSSNEVNQAVSKLNSAAEFMGVIKSDINSTVSSAVAKANSVLDKVNQLESLKSEIESLESKISAEKSKEEPNQSTINSLTSELNTKNSDFDKICEEGKSELAALKAMDKTVSTGSGSNGAGTGSNTDTSITGDTGTGSVLETYSTYLTNLKYGTFVKDVFTSPTTGKKMTYFLYLPDNVQNLKGLPTLVYLHGGNSHNNGMGSLTEYGLCPKIGNKQVIPQGIVILPHVSDFEGNAGKVCQNTIIELTNTIVNKYQGDKNRISLAGHSYGAIVGYKMINEHPGYFSAFVPISGWNQVTNEFKNVKVWAFHGTRDNRGGASRTTYPGACKTVEQINALGGKAKMSPLEGMGHSYVQNKVLEQKFTSPDGKQETYLEWAMRQTRATKA